MSMELASPDRQTIAGWMARLILCGAAVIIASLILSPLANAWSLAPDLGHGWAAPILIVFLWWERWNERPGIRAKPQPGLTSWIVLVVAVLGAIPLRLLLTPYPLWPVALIFYAALLVGATLYITGKLSGIAGVRWVGGPLLILMGVMPWPGAIERVLILPLREGIATLVAEISNLAGHPALASGTSVHLANGWVGIDEACGGIRSLQAAVTTALFFGEWMRMSWARRIGLILVGGLIAVVGNFGRVLFLSWCATGSEGMLDRWHDFAGWGALGFTLVATGVVGWFWGKESLASQQEVSTPRTANLYLPRAGAVWLGIFLGGLALIEGGTRWWYWQGKEQMAPDHGGWTAHLPTDSPSFRAQALTDTAEEMLRPDRFSSGAWFEADGLQRSANYIEWSTGQMARSAPFLHNPTVCLPYAGCELIAELGVINVVWDHGEIPFHTYLFRRMNEDLIVAFTIWDTSREKLLREHQGGWGGWWRSQWQDVIEARQHQPAQLLSFMMPNLDNNTALHEELEKIIRSRGVRSD